jgi:hypothetical protein
MDLFLYNKKQFLSSKSKDEIKSLILANSSIPTLHIRNFFIRQYKEDKLLCTFNKYSFRLTHLKSSNNEYEIVLTGNISSTKESSLVKIKARPSRLKIFILIFFAVPLSIGIASNLYHKQYAHSVLCGVILTIMYLFNYALFKYESVRLLQVFSRILNNEKPFLSNSLQNKPSYTKP